MADETIIVKAPTMERIQNVLNWATKLRHDAAQSTQTYLLCDTIIELATYAMAVELDAIDKFDAPEEVKVAA
jgi:hypothetical protein